MSDSKLEPSTFPASFNRRTPLYVLIGLYAVCDVAIATIIDARSDVAGGILLGVIFSQIILIAVGSALGPLGVFTRTVGGASLATMIALVLVACINRVNSGGRDQWLWFLIVTWQWCAIHFSLLGVRLCFGWRLAYAGEVTTKTSRNEVQFGIRQLMVWTTLVAATLGIGRWLLPEDIISGHARGDEIVVFSLLTSFTCLLAWPVVWASLTRRCLPLWLVAAALCCAALTLAEILTFEAAMSVGDNASFFWIMNPLQAIAACGGLLILRFSGFRLVRVRVRERLPDPKGVED